MADRRVSERSATFSDCGNYRYRLTRAWQTQHSTAAASRVCGTVAFLALNPSTADAQTDDGTIRRCMAFAERWGFSRMHVVNLFGFRARHPHDLKAAANPIGPGNDRAIAAVIRHSQLVVACWGNHGTWMNRDAIISQRYATRLHSLKVNENGTPAHPLYLPGDTSPVPYVPSCAT